MRRETKRGGNLPPLFVLELPSGRKFFQAGASWGIALAAGDVAVR